MKISSQRCPKCNRSLMVQTKDGMKCAYCFNPETLPEAEVERRMKRRQPSKN